MPSQVSQTRFDGNADNGNFPGFPYRYCIGVNRCGRGYSLLIFGLHLSVAEAAPIALLAVCLAVAIGALLGLMQKKVRYRAAGFIAITGAVGAPVGIAFAQTIPNAPITLLFALVLMYVANDMFRQNRCNEASAEAVVSRSFTKTCLLDTLDGRLVWTWPCVRALAISGFHQILYLAC